MPKAVVLVFPGSNGDRDLLETFARAGFDTSYHDYRNPLEHGLDLVGLPGGFAFGDYWRAGMLASQASAVRGIEAHVQRGGLAIGICNGFQILVEGGLLPGALRYNEPPFYRHRWLEVERVDGVDSPWLTGISAGTRLRMPMAHGEGNYYHPGGPSAIQRQVPFRYVKNPNGSVADAAALLDPTGRILGIMPHPERASEPALGTDDGKILFEAAYAYCEART
ncbi:MAG: phosphoribosylformylglycinamidine synthase I [Myxococcota bacterium]